MRDIKYSLVSEGYRIWCYEQVWLKSMYLHVISNDEVIFFSIASLIHTNTKSSGGKKLCTSTF